MTDITTIARLVVTLAAGIFFSAPAWAQDAAVVTLRSVLQRVLDTHPSVGAAKYDVQATDELYPQARAGRRPTVNGSASLTMGHSEAEDITVGDDGTVGKGAGITAEQSLYKGGRTKAEMGRAKALSRDANARLSAREQQALLETATAYLDVIRDTQLLSLAQQNVARLQQETDATQARLQAGDVTATDLHQAQARFSRAWSDYMAAFGTLNASRARFESSAGMQVPNALSYPSQAASLPDTLPRALSGSDSNPDIRQAIALAEASNKTIDMARADRRPQLALFASYDYQRDPLPGVLDDASESVVGLRTTMPFYTGGLLSSRVLQASYTAERDKMQIKDVRRVVEENIAQSWARMVSAKTEYAARQTETSFTVTAAEGVREEARLGERTVLDILDAEQEILDAQAALVRARHDYTLSSYALAYNLGQLNPASAD